MQHACVVQRGNSTCSRAAYLQDEVHHLRGHQPTGWHQLIHMAQPRNAHVLHAPTHQQVEVHPLHGRQPPRLALSNSLMHMTHPANTHVPMHPPTSRLRSTRCTAASRHASRYAPRRRAPSSADRTSDLLGGCALGVC